MLIDLDDGELHIKDNGYQKISISPKGTNNNSYLAIYGQ
jgi:hypothetical protein